MKRLLLLSLLILFASPVYAACTGSGAVWSCPAGTTAADVNAAISSASDGATITFANGSYSGGWSLLTTNGVTLICATGATCTHSGTVALGFYTTIITKFYRVSGFTFTGSGFVIEFCSAGSCSGGVTQARVDHNTFTGGGSVLFGDNFGSAVHYGVVDHNTFTAAGNYLAVQAIAQEPDTAPAGDNWAANSLGTGNNLFIEDNTFTFTSMTNNGSGCIDSWGNQSIVARHNTATNCRILSHGVPHAGPQNFEVYNNTVTDNSDPAGLGYRLIHHQGSGTFMVFNNVLSPANGSNMALLHYRAWTAVSVYVGAPLTLCDGTAAVDGNRSGEFGYPCYHQPGRDKDRVLHPIYLWNNQTSGGANINLSVETGGSGSCPGDCTTQQVAANRDYYQGSSTAQTSQSASLTTGMQFGPLAFRPTVCSTAGTDSADAGHGGVGYFATDVGAQGTLYQCSSTNTWTTYYTPYAYPHPLVTSGGAQPPAPPTNLRAVVQ